MMLDHRAQEAMIKTCPLCLQAHALGKIARPDACGVKALQDAKNPLDGRLVRPRRTRRLGKRHDEIAALIERADEEYSNRLFGKIRKANIHLAQQFLLERECNWRSEVHMHTFLPSLRLVWIICIIGDGKGILYAGVFLIMHRSILHRSAVPLLHLKQRILQKAAFNFLRELRGG